MENPMILAGILIVAMIAVRCGAQEGSAEELEQQLMTCMKKLDISDEEFTEAMKKHDFSDPKFKCWTTCMMEEGGIIIDRQFNSEKMKELFKPFENQSAEQKFEEAHEICVVEVQHEADDCEMVEKYKICLLAKIH